MADYFGYHDEYDYGRPYRRTAARSGRPQAGYRAWRGGDAGWREYDAEYGRDFESSRRSREEGYGETYGRKSRWETDYGDPFGDRERGTRIRVMRGGWDEYGRDFVRYGAEYRPRRRFLSGRTTPGARAAGEFYGPPGEYGREYRSRRWRY